MERGRYVLTRRGQASALKKRRMRRITVMLDQQPQSKNIKTADKIAFQRAVVDRLDAVGQSAYRGPVFLQMDFFNAAKNPPAIYRLPKNYLDLLGKPVEGAGIDRPRLLYRDDRQVKALVVRYHLRGFRGEPAVWLRAEPFRDFIADAHLTERISRDDFEEDDRRPSSSYDLGHDPFRDDDGRDDDGFERLADWERDRTSIVRRFGNDAFESMRQLNRMEAHQGFLRSMERHVCAGVLYAFQNTSRKKGESHDGFMNRLAFQTRNMSLASPFTLELPCAPRQKGEGEVFDRDLRTALEGFKTKHYYLFPLATSVNVTVLMIPPEGGGKDLDNLATRIVKPLQEIWSPPSSFAHAYNTDNIEDEAIREHWNDARNEVPKDLKNSIVEYRVFELPRLPDDSKDGFVRLAVGDGLGPVHFREEIDDYLKKWEEAVDG